MTTMGTTTLVVPSLPLDELLLLARSTPVVAAAFAAPETDAAALAASALARASALACDAELAEIALAAADAADAEAAATAELVSVGAALAAAACCCCAEPRLPLLLDELLWSLFEARLLPLLSLLRLLPLLLVALLLDELEFGRVPPLLLALMLDGLELAAAAGLVEARASVDDAPALFEGARVVDAGGAALAEPEDDADEPPDS